MVQIYPGRYFHTKLCAHARRGDHYTKTLDIDRGKEREKKNILNLSRAIYAQAKAQKEYSAADKEVKASVKKDKNNFVEELASQVEEAAGQGNLKDLYMLTRKLSGRFQQSNMPIRNKEGQMLMTTEQQLKQ